MFKSLHWNSNHQRNDSHQDQSCFVTKLSEVVSIIAPHSLIFHVLFYQQWQQNCYSWRKNPVSIVLTMCFIPKKYTNVAIENYLRESGRINFLDHIGYVWCLEPGNGFFIHFVGKSHIDVVLKRNNFNPLIGQKI